MKSIGIAGARSSVAVASRSAAGVGDVRQPLAQRAVADLVVVLQEVHEGVVSGRCAEGSPRGSPLRCAEASPW